MNPFNKTEKRNNIFITYLYSRVDYTMHIENALMFSVFNYDILCIILINKTNVFFYFL